jgi:zinc transporter ZupT
MSTSGIDPRGPQFTASFTALVLLAVLLLADGARTAATALLAVQAALFAWGALAGVQHTPVAWVFRTLVRPRLGAPDHLEDPAPPRFAQAVGLGFAVVGLVGLALDVPVLAYVAVGAALVAALLNAAFRFCLGCEVYLLVRRLSPAASSASTAPN